MSERPAAGAGLAARSPAVGGGVAPLRVLMLEDSVFDAELLTEALLRAYPQAQIKTVRDEAGYIAALRQARFELILSDFELPGYSGQQALELARSLAPQVPFVFVSGVIGEDNAVELLRQGATDYVSKGRLSRLPMVVDRALREVAVRDGRVRAERALQDNDLLFGRLVDSLADYAVVLLDAQARVLRWNLGARQIFGAAESEALGRGLHEFLTSREGPQPMEWLHASCAGGSFNAQLWLQPLHGEPCWADVVVACLDAQASAAAPPVATSRVRYCLIIRDRTAEHRNAEALRAAVARAEAAQEEMARANEAKDRFLAIVSHELRNPLAAVSFAAQLLQRLATVPERHKDLIPGIRRNVELEARLIDDLLDVSTITSGKLSLRADRLDAASLPAEVGEMMRGALADKKLKLSVRGVAEGAWVRADAARIKQVIANLLRNAIKFSPAGATIRLESEVNDGHFVVRVVDHGIGIAPDALERIFKAFEQADREVARQFGGLGLGLAIARHLVIEHGGMLTATSAGPGQGATFEMRLPLADREETQPLRAAPSLPPPPAAAAQGARVLMVEDNRQAAELLMLFLQDYGYAITHAATVAEGLACAAQNEFDIVLTDLGLPDGSGVEIGRALGARLPVVALSGYGSPIDRQRTQAAGFAAHLVKPADPEAVHETLQAALRRTA
ncbi:hybrid sensor histidine kinase/response regulator [Pseudacidovorax sp. NFM-22]|uniref:hybrid sensor histidine kinase/response regulator n=1 Tax=Pseudacidovorax sp. NFM-22 TaxID=2744469 RepID=UPI001F16E691|nr:response regulator [Pseudacidovorax sp. NFM-22]